MEEVPRKEVKKEPITCSGPGGQNVNKGMMGRRLRWNPRDSEGFTDEEIERICKKIKLTQKGEIVIDVTDSRSASRNLENGFKRLDRLVNQALKQKKKRKKTKPSKAAIERRLQEKKRKSEIKKSRQKIKYF